MDQYIRTQINDLDLRNTSALFPICFWNMVRRLEEGLSRTNNSLEAFFHIWSDYIKSSPRLSSFIKRVLKEDERWQNIVNEYDFNPAHGIRGGLTRRKKWIQQDQSLEHYVRDFNTTDPMRYLKRIAYKISKNLK